MTRRFLQHTAGAKDPDLNVFVFMNSTGPTFFHFTAFPQLQDQDIRPDTFKFLAVLNIEATRQQTNGPQTPVEHLCCEGSQTEGRGRSRGLRSPFVVINC